MEDEFYEEGSSFTHLDRKAKNAIAKGYDALIVQNVYDGTNYPIDDYIVTNPNQIKSATDNVGTFSTENDDIRFFIDKNKLPKEELAVLSSALMTKYGNKTDYGAVICTANYEYCVNYKGAGEFDILEYHAIDNNINKKYNDTERTDVSGSLDELSKRDEITEGEYNSSGYNVENREANGNYATLDQNTLQRESDKTTSNVSSQEHQGWSTIKRDSATGRITFTENGETISSTEDWNNTSFFLTPQGEVYSFVDRNDEIILSNNLI